MLRGSVGAQGIGHETRTVLCGQFACSGGECLGARLRDQTECAALLGRISGAKHGGEIGVFGARNGATFEASSCRQRQHVDETIADILGGDRHASALEHLEP